MITYLTLAIALVSLIIAYLAHRIASRQPWAQALFQIVDRLEKPEMRSIRHHVVYKYPAEAPEGWSADGMTREETEAAINRWGAEMDVLALLYFSGQLHRVQFFEIYGDVIIRSVYKLAPHANAQRKIRGEQFWLPFQGLARELLGVWKKRAKKGCYPMRIGVPGSEIQLTRQELMANHELRMFLSANNKSVR